MTMLETFTASLTRLGEDSIPESVARLRHDLATGLASQFTSNAPSTLAPESSGAGDYFGLQTLYVQQPANRTLSCWKGRVELPDLRVEYALAAVIEQDAIGISS